MAWNWMQRGTRGTKAHNGEYFLIFSMLLAACSSAPKPALNEQQGSTHAAGARDGSLASRALAEPNPRTSKVVQALRDRGPSGLAAVIAAAGPAPNEKAREVIAVVAAQLDADVSGLYWHTDFDRAVAAAQAEGKPILSLRLLGRLDDELSCANSRLFRTTLYPDAEVSRLLRENFVLHWTSERKVPRITIDYGDGRTLERTITGNSIHYVMDEKGRVVDALPGLYAPQAFARELRALRVVAQRVGGLSEESWTEAVQAHHRDALTRTRSALMTNLGQAGLDTGAIAFNAPMPRKAARQPGRAAPSAQQAVPIAITKSMLEAPVLKGTQLQPRVPSFGELDRRIDRDSVWQRLAKLDGNAARLDAASRRVIARKTPVTWEQSDGLAKPAMGKDLQRMLSLLETHIAEDTLKNELLLRRRIHEWLSKKPMGYQALNTRVYRDLFLTPASDPWLGLLPQDVFSGLPNGGVRTTR